MPMHYRPSIALGLAVAPVAVSQCAQAQEQGSAASAMDASRDSDRPDRTNGADVRPYIEASQVVTAQIEPGSDVLTYTQLAAGVDASVTGRNSAASASLRYERDIGYGNAVDSDTISGIARASMGLYRRGVTLEAGGLASRTSVDGSGFSSVG